MRTDSYKRIFSFLILSWSLMFVPVIEAHAQSTVVVSRMGPAIAGLVRAKAARWGFAANDPRVTATIYGINGGLTVLSAGAAVVSWPVLVTAAGIGAVAVGGYVYLSSDSSTGQNYGWQIGSDGSITASGKIPGTAYSGEVLNGSVPPKLDGTSAYGVVEVGRYDPVAGKAVYDKVYSTDPLKLASLMAGVPANAKTDSCVISSYYQQNICQIYENRPGQPYRAYEYRFPWYPGGGAPVRSDSGTFDGRPPPPATTITPVSYANADEAAKAVPAAIKAAALPNESLAAAANVMWKAAVSPNESGGIPYSASDPITPQDVSNWVSAGNSVPTVGDFLGGPLSGGGGFSLEGGMSSGGGGSTSPSTPTQPGPTPTTPTEPVPPVTPGEGQEIDWGPNPNIGAPGLESMPTKESILDPMFKLMPDLKSFSVPSHQAVCPVANFSLFGNAYVMDSHCGLFEQNRGVLGAAMVLAYTILAVRIVLKA